MTNSMRVKILNKFPSPLNNRMAEVDSEMTVPKSQFWFKRLNDKDCIQIKFKSKTKAAVVKAAVVDKPKKGSK